MGRKSTLEKNRVYVECSDVHRKVKGLVIDRNENFLRVELPTGFVMDLVKTNNKSAYKFQVGLLEFFSDGRPVV